MKKILFIIAMILAAPLIITPKNCPFNKVYKCKFWNCSYHYLNDKYTHQCNR